MKIGTMTTSDAPNVAFPEGLLIDAIRTHIKQSNFPKKVIIKQLELLIDKYQEKQEAIAKRIVAVNDGNDEMKSDMERLRQKNHGAVITLRGKLA